MSPFHAAGWFAAQPEQAEETGKPVGGALPGVRAGTETQGLRGGWATDAGGGRD